MTGGLGWQPSPAAWLAVLAAAFATGTAIIGYRRAKYVRFAKAMLALRVAALGLLAIAAFAPTLQLSASTDQKRAMVCVVDDSLSMAQTDQRPDGQSLRVAEALGFIAPAGWAGDGLLDQARQMRTALSDVEAARAQRDQARLADQPVEIEQRKLADLSAALSASAAAMLSKAQADSTTRFAVEKIQRIATAIADGNAALPGRTVEELIDDLERHHRQAYTERARLDAAAGDAVKRIDAMSRYDLAVAAIARLRSAAPSDASTVLTLLDGTTTSVPPPKPTRPASPITAGLAAVVDRFGAADSECIILLSDGRSTESRPALSPALLGAGVPIYTVQLAAPQNDPDVRIVELSAPSTALVGEAVPLHVLLQNRNAVGTTVHVTVTDAKTTISRDVTLGAGQDTVSINWPAAALPALKLSAVVDAIPNERQEQNNRAEASVAVVDQKLHVILVTGSAGWDLQYLRNALARSPWVKLQQQILEPGEKCRISPNEFSTADVVILGDVGSAALDGDQCDAIQKAVSTGGKSALLLPGDAQWLSNAALRPQLAGLVPQRTGEQPAWRFPPSETPTILPVPSPAAESLPLLKLEDAPDASINRWLARPRLYRYIAAGELKPQVRPLLVDRTTQTPLIVEQTVGSGRSMTLLIDEIWRWRSTTGAETGDRFWLDLVRELIDPPMSKTDGTLSIGVDRDPHSAGRPMTVRARVPADIAAKTKLSLSINGKIVSTLSPAEMLPGSGRLTAVFTPEIAGTAELLLKAGASELRLPLTISDATGEELADTAGDPALLNRIAQQSGGMMVPLEGLGGLPPQIALRRQSRVDTIHIDLWSSPYWFAAVVGCLGLEWAMRKLAGMV